MLDHRELVTVVRRSTGPKVLTLALLPIGNGHPAHLNPATRGADQTPWPHSLQSSCSISSEP